ncbi:MAG: c-type cytochrome [Nitrospira sp. CR2.1]|nr:c-type cytochrome [Nitrospira sp. CR2.1]
MAEAALSLTRRKTRCYSSPALSALSSVFLSMLLRTRESLFTRWVQHKGGVLMGYFSKFVGVCAAVTLLSVAVVGAEEKDPLKPRVAPDQMADAKAMKNPVASTPESIAKGKALYEGKGTCFNCHGKEGKGDGPAGAILNPSPRNFTNCKFHKKRKDGELFWVIKNGSAGTGMVSLIPAAITEEEAWTIINYERSFCKGGEE